MRGFLSRVVRCPAGSKIDWSWATLTPMSETTPSTLCGQFDLGPRLGRGGFGTVFKAWDRERDREVAVKWLHRFHGSALLKFKDEFRILQRIRHSNVIRLGRLVSDGADWCFSMDLIEGTTFLDRVAATTQPPHDPNVLATVSTQVDVPGEESAPARRLDAPSTYDDRRLRDAMAQLAVGVQALHERDVLHRDLKPSNVLVEHGGRVVIVDFGLAKSLSEGDGNTSFTLMGTPAYMSPARLDHEASTEADDWYSVGIMLFEALTGKLPFLGNVAITQKRTGLCPDPRERRPTVAPDLAGLCMELLAPEPANRATGAPILTVAGGPSVVTRTAPSPRRRVSFVGRSTELASLDAALASVGGGGPRTALILGSSGIGKSALLDRFLNRVVEDSQAVVLRGRCYEQESVPYKALDSVVDALASYLRGVPKVVAARVRPRGAAALVRVFPVLQEVEEFARALSAKDTGASSQDIRRRATTAFRELLGAMADERPLVLAIDDVQWGDDDSAGLLSEVLRPPEAPPLLLVMGCRKENADSSPLVAVLPHDTTRITLGPLSEDEAAEMARALSDNIGSASATTIGREGRGSPLFVELLSREVSEGHRPSLEGGSLARSPNSPRNSALCWSASRWLADQLP